MKFVYQEWHINIYLETKGFNLTRSTINIGLIWLLIFKHKDHSLSLALKFITNCYFILTGYRSQQHGKSKAEILVCIKHNHKWEILNICWHFIIKMTHEKQVKIETAHIPNPY